MSDERYKDRMDTESSSGDKTRILQSQGKESGKFEYKILCKKNIQKPKKEMDAYFLMPIKLYHDLKDISKEGILPVLEGWMMSFLQKKFELMYFWAFLCDMATNETEPNWVTWELELEEYTAGYMESCLDNVGKVEQNNYIRNLLLKRDDVEYWILKVYELTLRKMFTVGELSVFIGKIVKYLNECGIHIKMPTTIQQTVEKQEYFYMFAANLMLLVFRLRFKIEKAVEWYYHCNNVYLRCYDWMLDEYIQLVEEHSMQSYERFWKMKKVADESRNKYAAKEVGDVYRLGMWLEGENGNKIYIEPDAETACKYYRICIESSYTPAIISAVKTGALIREWEKEELLQQCVKEHNVESYMFYAQKNIKNAQKYINNDFEKGIEYLEKSAKILQEVGDNYAIKHVLINDMLSLIYRSTTPSDIKMLNYPNLGKLYLTDIFTMDKSTYQAVLEENYLKASALGYFEAEYQLAKLYEKDNTKYKDYIAKGCEKGCKWCLFERNRELKTRDPMKWAKNLMELWKSPVSEQLQLEILKEIATCERVLNCKKQDEEYFEVVVGLLLPIKQGTDMLSCSMSVGTSSIKKKKNELLSRLYYVEGKVLEVLQNDSEEIGQGKKST